MTAKGGTAIAGVLDVSSPDAGRDVVEDVVSQWGTIDILVNNSDGGAAAYSASKGAVRSLMKHGSYWFANDNVPLAPHIGEPSDIAYGIVYLASDEAKFVTGEELIIDGGYATH